ncbi:hypothetical protein N7532_007873 [Penicillium argentinense]|uniref:Mid2 domain-containing protein n=1 Tax=Penicillium argentinense TaxID=1131581 RepID=A0A9W9K125_9EURO|nr:uncharacterized protein N7532_007873 [Penicillium argentinense]KAJ5089189.1 hypothetical protein N7532_007873 [Penicillium argentinense]
MFPIIPYIVSLLAVALYTRADGGISTASDSLPKNQQGYVSISSSWSAATCEGDGQSYVMSSTYGRCCANTKSNCGFATSCRSPASGDATILYGGGGSSTCTQGDPCIFMTIYDTATTDTPHLDIFCANGWPTTATIAFRTVPAETTAAETGSHSTSIATPGASPTTSLSSSTATSDPSNEKKESKAWIAGAVIGPIAGCAIFGALGFWLAWRLRNKHKHGGQPEAHDTVYSDAPKGRHFVELGQSSALHEMPGNSASSKAAPSELYAGDHR